MDLAAVRETHAMITLVHRFVYFVPEAQEEFAAVGTPERLQSYFGSRAAPLGPVPPEVVIATFYNFSPDVVRRSMEGLWEQTSPEAFQAARYRAAERAMARVGATLTPDDLAEATTLLTTVMDNLDLAGRPIAAGNRAVERPADPLVALWQMVSVLREWRGDAHLALLVANEVGPCDCTVLQVTTGRAPAGVTRAMRQWTDDEWAAATGRLVERGWFDEAGAVTELGSNEREQLEVATDELCARVWEPIGEAAMQRVGSLITPIHEAFDAVGTFGPR